MYPDLSYILHAIFGTEPDGAASIVKTFGLLLACAFFASAYVLVLEMKRKEAEGILKPVVTKRIVGNPATILELILAGLIGFVVGAKLLYIIQNFGEFQADAMDVLFSRKGSLIGGLIGLAVNAGLRWYNKNRERLPEVKEVIQTLRPFEKVGDITIQAAIWGLIGGKLFAILEDPTYFFQDPIGTVFSGSGMAVNGGLILAFFGVSRYIKRLGFGHKHMMDACAPAVVMGNAVGRIGCQLSGDGDWGIVNEAAKPDWIPQWLWAQEYPHNVLRSGIRIEDCEWLYCNKLSPPVYPTPIYETAMFLVILAIIWSLRKRIKIPGVIFFLTLVLIGIQRFFIEMIRDNESYSYDIMGKSISQAQLIAPAFLLIGIIGMIYLYRKSEPVKVE